MSNEPADKDKLDPRFHNIRLVSMLANRAIKDDPDETLEPIGINDTYSMIAAFVEEAFHPKSLDDIKTIYAGINMQLDTLPISNPEETAEDSMRPDERQTLRILYWATTHKDKVHKAAHTASVFSMYYLLSSIEIQKEEYEGKSLFTLTEEGVSGQQPIPGSQYEKLFNTVADQIKEILDREKAELAAVDMRPTLQRPDNMSSMIMLNNKIGNPTTFFTLEDIFYNLDPDGQITMMSDIQQPVTVRNEVKSKKTGKILKPAVVSLVSLNYYGDLSGKLARIKGFDQSVLNAVCSLVNADCMVFTLEDIWYVLTQKNRRKSRPTQKQLERIKLSLRKFEGTKIEIDVSNEIKEQLLTADGERITPIIKENLLYFREFIGRTESGKEVVAIQLIKTPILWEYSMAKANPQIVTIPIEWLQLGSNTNATEDNIAIRDYLLKEIRQMQTGNRDNDVINYESILRVVDVKPDELNYSDKGTYTETISNLLDTFKERGIIKGWKQRNGRYNKVIGFKIILNA